jgi:hypothetical protein
MRVICGGMFLHPRFLWRRMRAKTTAIGVLLLGLSLSCGATTRPAPRDPIPLKSSSGISESDYGSCVRLCEKQRRCDGQSVTENSVKICADDCYRSLSKSEKRLTFVRKMKGCLSNECGDQWTACKDNVSAVVAKGTKTTKRGRGGPLTRDECAVVCRKTFVCLGAGATTTEAVTGCVEGCIYATGTDARRMRAILRCGNIPCGEKFQACSASVRP